MAKNRKSAVIDTLATEETPSTNGTTNGTAAAPKVTPSEQIRAEAVQRRAAYETMVAANREKRNEARQSRLQAVKELMEAGKSMPAIAAELGLTYRQVKHVAWYIQHPDVAVPTR